MLFGRVSGASTTIVSPDELKVTVPAHAPRIVNLRVVTAAGTSLITRADRFTVKPRAAAAGPVVSSVSPQASAPSRGAKVTVTGSGFSTVTKVSFGSVAGINVSVISARKLTVTAPAQPPATVNVRVTTSAGTSAITTGDRYTYKTVKAGDQSPATGCQHITGPFHTSGATVYDSKGQRYIPYGLNVTGLAHPLGPNTLSEDENIIHAAATYWCANTVRLQIGQDYTIDSSGHTIKSELSAIATEVHYAESLGLLVVLNCQTQTGPQRQTQEFMPTERTIAFWDSLSYWYKSDPNVIFDLFNEPSYAPTWQNWRTGGTLHGVKYLGMQTVAARVRDHDGAPNLFWIEGLQVGGSLQYAWQYRLSGVYPLMYSEHRPAQPYDSTRWYSLFGYLAKHKLAPVVAGEEADYARTNADWACWDNAPQSYPAFLNYLGDHQIGGIFTKLIDGQLIESSNVNDPTRFKLNWSCTTGLDQGAGQVIQDWMKQHNG